MQEYTWDQLMKQAENAGGGEPVPSTDYTVVISSAEAKTTGTGKPMLKTKAKIQGGPYNGRTLFNNITLSVENDAAVAIFMRHMKAFGLGAEYFATNPSFEQLAIALVGRTVIYDVTQRDYQGSMRNDVQNIKPASGVPGVAAAAPPPPQAGIPQVPVPPAPPAPPVPVPPAPVAEVPAPLAPPAAPTPPPPPPVPTPPVPEVPVSSTPAPPEPPF